MASSASDIKVLVIDDSAYNRQSIADMLSRIDGISVVGRAGDGNEGLKQVVALEPDIITLDLEMPKMDGYTFLRILMTRRPTPVIVISSHSHRDSVFKALELGAVDFIAKPARVVSPELQTIESDLADKIKMVSRLRPVRLRRPLEVSAAEAPPALEIPEPPPVAPVAPEPIWSEGGSELLGVICIGASTGGPPALKEIFESLPANMPIAVLVSQHMPASFTGPFARRLDGVSALTVREAKSGDSLSPGLALVAPGSGSLAVEMVRGELRVNIEPPGTGGSHVRIVPSANRMMESAVAAFGKRVMGVVLTGMGNDGSRGVEAIRGAGGMTVAEAEKTAVIFGMPDAAIRTGAVDEVLPLGAVAAAMVRFAQICASK
jgi:two-component system chemotaxis response regulator CheB